MNVHTTSTKSAKGTEVTRAWFLIDATGIPLGRLASHVAFRLRGKHKPSFTPHVDTGDCIIVVNAKGVKATGNKLKDKVYYHHTGHIGGMKATTLEKQMEKDARKVIETAVRGMLPKNPLGRAMIRKLKVYNDATHEHAAQQPQVLELDI